MFLSKMMLLLMQHIVDSSLRPRKVKELIMVEDRNENIEINKNREISKFRYTVEQTFEFLKLRFGYTRLDT